MIGAWMVWGAVMLVGTALRWFGSAALGAAVQIAALVVPLASAVLHFADPPRISGAFCSPKTAAPGAEWAAVLTLHGRLRFYRCIRVTVRLQNALTGETLEQTARAAWEGGRTAAVQVRCRARDCGALTLTAPCIRLYDAFGLFFRTVSLPARGQTVVLPVLQPLTVTFRSAAGRSPDAAPAPDARPGPDLSEPYALRAYQPGDSLHSIQWKLSQKHGALIVRQGTQPVNHALRLVPFAGECTQPQALAAMAALTASLSAALCDLQLPHALVLDDLYPIDRDDDLAAVLPKLLTRCTPNIPDDDGARTVFIAAAPPAPHELPIGAAVLLPDGGNAPREIEI